METRCQRILDAQDEYVESINTRELKWAVRAGLASLRCTSISTTRSPSSRPRSRRPPRTRSSCSAARCSSASDPPRKRARHARSSAQPREGRRCKSTWLEQARSAKAAVEKQLEAEKAELAKLPYTEEQLKKALDEVVQGVGRGNLQCSAPNDPRARAEARIGAVLNDKWTLERLIGLGGMAAVYASRRSSARGAVEAAPPRARASPRSASGSPARAPPTR